MKFKTFLSRWIANRIESRARQQRRALRDYHRHEFGRIHELEMRSRGLRLYAAWLQHRNFNIVQTEASDWRRPLHPANLELAGIDS